MVKKAVWATPDVVRIDTKGKTRINPNVEIKKRARALEEVK